jgi:hypothetical protein
VIALSAREIIQGYGNLMGRYLMEDLRMGWRIILKWILKE